MRSTGKVPEDSFVVIVHEVGLYPGTPYKEGILALKTNLLKEQSYSKISTNDQVKSAEFVLKNNFSEFDKEVKQKISGTAISTKFALPYTCIYMAKPSIYI